MNHGKPIAIELRDICESRARHFHNLYARAYANGGPGYIGRMKLAERDAAKWERRSRLVLRSSRLQDAMIRWL